VFMGFCMSVHGFFLCFFVFCCYAHGFFNVVAQQLIATDNLNS
jgi:hypothetical protein